MAGGGVMLVGRSRCVSGVLVRASGGLIGRGVGVVVCVVHGGLLTPDDCTPGGYNLNVK